MQLFTDAVKQRMPNVTRHAVDDKVLLALKHMPKRKGGPLYKVNCCLLSYLYRELYTYLCAYTRTYNFSFVYIHGFVDVGHDAEVHFIHMLEHILLKPVGY